MQLQFKNILDHLTFWLPNRGTTGIGISLFSYKNNLNFGIIADENLIPNVDDLNWILEMLIKSLYEM